ncbi:MAG TPA: hypothetical protein VF092_16945 [Longimicrobium sp.]
MKFRKLLPLVVAALTLAACSADALTGPTRTAPAHRDESNGSGMLGGGGNLMGEGSGMLGGGG